MSADTLINADLVRRLITRQFPHWAELPVRPVEPGGWDSRTFHLGDELTVRLPSGAGYADQVAKEHRWLPVLAAQLPLPVATPVARGVPAEGYPFGWSVYEWIEGDTATVERIGDLTTFAKELAGFLVALQQIDPTGGPPAGLHNFFRGGPLETYDDETHDAIEALGDRVDREAATSVWETALATAWDGPPVWVHGDVAAGNLLVRDGRLAAVIDFGCMGVGDPACDLAIGWTLLSGESRRLFREGLALDPGTWARGRGWALWKALITLAEYGDAAAAEAAAAGRVIGQIFDEYSTEMLNGLAGGRARG